MWVEVDVLEATDHVCSQYAIDEDRIVRTRPLITSSYQTHS